MTNKKLSSFISVLCSIFHDRYLFPCGDSMVCIIDDREDVWKFAPNLITVKKYIYFQGTGDINAPPGSRDAQVARKGTVLLHMSDRVVCFQKEPVTVKCWHYMQHKGSNGQPNKSTVQWALSCTMHASLWEALWAEVNKQVRPEDSLTVIQSITWRSTRVYHALDRCDCMFFVTALRGNWQISAMRSNHVNDGYSLWPHYHIRHRGDRWWPLQCKICPKLMEKSSWGLKQKFMVSRSLLPNVAVKFVIDIYFPWGRNS